MSKLSSADLIVLRLAETGSDLEIEMVIALSGLNESAFYQSIATLKKQRYLTGDAFLGYTRTNKPIPTEAQS